MHFGPTSAQEALREEVRALLTKLSPPSAVRRLMETETGFDPETWSALAGEGLLGDLGWVERCIVLEETGRALMCAPYLATVTAAALLPDDLRHGIAQGRGTATLAVAEESGRWDEGGVEARAVASPAGGWRLEGAKSYVVAGLVADVLVVAARRGDRGSDVGLFLVDGAAPGVARRPLATVDATRKQAAITFAAAPARPVEGTVAAAMDLAAVALAAEQVGGAERCLEMAVAHARRRVQFGRPIGSFQAVKHLCAGMLLEVESARSAAFYAATAAARRDPDLPAAAAVAKSSCSETYVRVATDSLHVHGGLGFTWDHDAHLYFKRARSSRLLFGDPRHHREQLARHVGL